MRVLLVFTFVFLAFASARAQEQEKKLMDRVLKPNTSLQNEAQGKEYQARGGVLSRLAHTKPFFISRRSWEKRYAGVQEFQVKEYNTQQSRFAGQTANTSTRKKLVKVSEPYSTTAYVTRSARESEKAVTTSAYPGNRAFAVEGKSQKSLNRQPRPMTIDEVRELLNKNK